MDRQDLFRRAARGTSLFILALAALTILPAGLFAWKPWLFWLHFTLWCVALTGYFYRVDPALLERRLRGGPAAETEPSQKRIQSIMSSLMLTMFVVSAFDCRFGWSRAPIFLVLLGHASIAAGFLFVAIVLRENSFAAATIGVVDNQPVISTGPYALMRHPMYAGAAAIFAGVPLALGSLWGLVFIPLLIWMLAARLIDEESYLIRNLPGYADYCAHVRFRLAPGLW